MTVYLYKKEFFFAGVLVTTTEIFVKVSVYLKWSISKYLLLDRLNFKQWRKWRSKVG